MSAAPLLRRLWIYQGERIPLGRTALLTAVFTSASLCASAALAGRPVPGLAGFAAAFVVVLALFIALRVADEHKDAADDARYRPERPVPRGLVTLAELRRVGAGAGALASLASLALVPAAFPLLILVWVWFWLMTKEFYAPAFLRARPALYLISHMAIMPLMDLYVTGCEWAPARGGPAPALALFLGLSFANGCVLELGRKTWAPQSEREGVETYSRLWGPRGAARTWLGFVALASLLAAGVCVAERALTAGALLIAPGALVAALVAVGFAARPDGIRQKRVDQVSGLWVFLCYTAAGFSPFAMAALR